MKSITVEMLQDIVESQFCVHGNQALFIHNMEQDEKEFMLFAGDSVELPIFECTSKYNACESEYGIKSLLERLENIDNSLTIYCSDDNQIKKGFKLGFKSEGHFVLTLESNELEQPTVVIN